MTIPTSCLVAREPSSTGRHHNGSCTRCSAAAQYHVVAVDQCRAPGKAQDGGDFAGPLADDAGGVLPRIGYEPAAEFAPVGRPDDDGIAALEGALHTRHSGRQQAFSIEQRPLGPGVDLDIALRLELAGDPAF